MPSSTSNVKFEKKAIFIAVFQFLFVMVVVLPTNLTGGKDKKGFGKTTFNIVQLEKNQTILVPRIILTIVNFILVCTIGFLFYKNLIKIKDEHSTRTVMIRGLPESTNTDDLKTHFSELGASVLEVVYHKDCNQVMKIDEEREPARKSRLTAQRLAGSTRKHPLTSSRIGRLCSCLKIALLFTGPCFCSCCVCSCLGFCSPEPVNAVSYYSQKEEELTKQQENARNTSMAKWTGIAFVSFDSKRQAKSIVKLHKKPINFRKTTTTMTSVSQQLEVGQWTMKMAPLPKNIRYKTLNKNIQQERLFVRA
jgi:hypothetical protein